MLAYTIRVLVVFATFVLIAIDCFQQFALLSHAWHPIQSGAFDMLQFLASIGCSAIITNALLSLWRGTSFLKDIVDYEPEVSCLQDFKFR